jgi:phosphoglycolate phosphatase-like HAD superfamily hydrolase
MTSLIELNKKYKFLVLDFDGTIVKLNIKWKDLKNDLYNRFKLKYNFKSNSLSEMLRKIKGKDIDLTLGIIKTYEVPNSKPNYELIPHISQQLKKISNYYIISNNHTDTILLILKELNIKINSNKIIGLNSYFTPKPNINNFNELLKRSNEYNKNDYVYIGDRKSDAIFAKNIGVNFIYIDDLI